MWYSLQHGLYVQVGGKTLPPLVAIFVGCGRCGSHPPLHYFGVTHLFHMKGATTDTSTPGKAIWPATTMSSCPLKSAGDRCHNRLDYIDQTI